MITRQRILHEVRVTITSDKDIVTARQSGRQMAAESGFRSADSTFIAAAISEIGLEKSSMKAGLSSLIHLRDLRQPSSLASSSLA